MLTKWNVCHFCIYFLLITMCLLHQTFVDQIHVFYREKYIQSIELRIMTNCVLDLNVHGITIMSKLVSISWSIAILFMQNSTWSIICHNIYIMLALGGGTLQSTYY